MTKPALKSVIKTSKKTIKSDVNNVTLSLNKAAREIFGDADSVRVQMLEDSIRVRPTKRTKGLGNFPKTEKMLPLHKSASGIKFLMPQEAIKDATTFRIEELKYGWLEMHSTDKTGVARNVPVAKVNTVRQT